MVCLLDYNQAMLTSVIHSYNKVQVTEEFLYGSFLNRIREINKKYRNVYGDLVVCCEGMKSWRKDFFQFYKAKRKQARDDSYLDWPLILRVMNRFRDDLIENFPYSIMQIDEAEGDDIIAVLVKHFHESEKILIFSGDGDFAQLHKYPNVAQYSPIAKKFLKFSNPDAELKEKIIRGDSGDGIPNILTKDNIFLLEGIKQNRISSAKIDNWMKQKPGDFCTTEEMSRNWIRNETLIDFDYIPAVVENKILSEYQVQLNRPRKGKDQILNFLINKGLTNFMSDLQDF